jgi:predicted phosphodiesterase
MKIGFVSDVHSNLISFEAVLNHMNNQGVGMKVSLGDTVGYGPRPNECVELTVSNFNYIVMGNHDEASINLEKSRGFNIVAQEAIKWTNSNLTKSTKEYLKNLEYGYTTENGLLFVHGSPSEPFDYIFSDREAQKAFQTSIADFNIAFVGHTHVPGIWLLEGGKLSSYPIRYSNPQDQVGICSYIIPENARAIINVGSVGQPRDYDARASYVIFDTETRLVTYYRIPYRKDITIAQIKQAELPQSLWQRLMHGE